MTNKPTDAVPARVTVWLMAGVIVLLSAALAYSWRMRQKDNDEPAVQLPPSSAANVANVATKDVKPRDTRTRRYRRTIADYKLPAVTLLDAAGSQVALADELNHDGPLLMQFIFTTCPTICPVMTSTFSAVQNELADEPVRLVSISIDPEHDTPQQLTDYARRFQVTPRWRFLTGSRAGIATVQKAFDAYQDNKMRHDPLTFLRASAGDRWVRIDGMISAAELLLELAEASSAATDELVVAASYAPATVTGATCELCSPVEPNAELGRQIYQDGILPSGEPLRAVSLGDVAVSGRQVSCAGCHRDSGYAGGEETVYVPPITAPVLFHQRELHRGELFRKLFQDTRPKPSVARVRDGRYRPAYDDATLAAVIRHGIDPTGREMDRLMPRYELSDADMSHLVAYLRQLHAKPTLGVDDEQIHFATVVTPGVDPDKRAAMVDVIEAYIRRKNADTAAKLRRPEFSPLYKDEFRGAFRLWSWRLWELSGPEETWPAQLEEFYHEQPVFALISGIGPGHWQPVHDFCEAHQVPGLFPHTDLPSAASTGGYTMYFSQGVHLEAKVLAQHLTESVEAGDTMSLQQVYRDEPCGRAAADTLRSAIDAAGIQHLPDTLIENDHELTVDSWATMLGDVDRPVMLILWLESDDLERLELPADTTANVKHIYLSGRVAGTPLPASFEQLADRVRYVYPYALPGEEHPRIYRVRSWLRSRRIAPRHEPIQLNTYFALSITDHALVHLVEDFSREYLIESVEHETENFLNPGVYPHLSLGPHQRFASKGAYLVRRSGDTLEPVSRWIVP